MSHHSRRQRASSRRLSRARRPWRTPGPVGWGFRVCVPGVAARRSSSSTACRSHRSDDCSCSTRSANHPGEKRAPHAGHQARTSSPFLTIGLLAGSAVGPGRSAGGGDGQPHGFRCPASPMQGDRRPDSGPRPSAFVGTVPPAARTAPGDHLRPPRLAECLASAAMTGPRGRARRTALASLAQDPRDPAPTPEETFVAIRGWPGARPGQDPQADDRDTQGSSTTERPLRRRHRRTS